MGRRRSRRSPFRRYGIPLIAAASLSACAALLLLVGPSADPEPAPAPRAESPDGPPRAAADPPPGDDLDRLAALLAPVAHWGVARSGDPARWEGRVEEGETLIHWNSRVSAGIEAAGLEILEATEELVDRRGRTPLQRLTMSVGRAGRPLAEVLVEAPRAPSLPPAF